MVSSWACLNVFNMRTEHCLNCTESFCREEFQVVTHRLLKQWSLQGHHTKVVFFTMVADRFHCVDGRYACFIDLEGSMTIDD